MQQIQKSFDQRELVLNKLSRIRILASKIYKGTLIIQKQDYYKEKNEKEQDILYMRSEYGNIDKIKYNLSLCENAYVTNTTEIRLNKILLLLKNS